MPLQSRDKIILSLPFTVVVAGLTYVSLTHWHTHKRVSRNTAPRAPRTPRAPRWNIVKTSRRWCLGFNWISRKISRKRRKSKGENWRRGEMASYPPFTSTHSALRAVRCFVTSHGCHEIPHRAHRSLIKRLRLIRSHYSYHSQRKCGVFIGDSISLPKQRIYR